tara:strand:+ start:19813 stop:20097 length:285 start_codon:yes stop_codon:yes gene_type:complete
MIRLAISNIDGSTFKVEVFGETSTTHLVKLTDSYHKSLTQNNVDKEELIEFSFRFLLERESNSSILNEFSLLEITKYFNDYPKLARQKFDNSIK